MTRSTLTRSAMAVTLAFTVASSFAGISTPAHAQQTATLGPRARAAFGTVYPQIVRCQHALEPMLADIQTTSDNLSLGSTDTGTLGTTSTYAANVCYAAASALHRLHFPLGVGATAYRVQNESYLGLRDVAYAAQQTHRLAGAIEGEDFVTATDAMGNAAHALKTGNVHLSTALRLM